MDSHSQGWLASQPYQTWDGLIFRDLVPHWQAEVVSIRVSRMSPRLLLGCIVAGIGYWALAAPVVQAMAQEPVEGGGVQISSAVSSLQVNPHAITFADDDEFLWELPQGSQPWHFSVMPARKPIWGNLSRFNVGKHDVFSSATSGAFGSELESDSLTQESSPSSGVESADQGNQANEEQPQNLEDSSSSSADLDLPAGTLENSPVLQEWLEKIPDISDDIRNEPSFRTRLRIGYAQFPSSGQIGGFDVGFEDAFVFPETGFTISGNYSRSWNGERQSYGADAHYYLLPLGGYVNLSPIVGYRYLETSEYVSEGVNVGFRMMLIPSRGGAADIAVDQVWVAPGGPEEVTMTSVSLGYAVTHQLRVSADLEFQNSQSGQDSQLGIFLEWLPR